MPEQDDNQIDAEPIADEPSAESERPVRSAKFRVAAIVAVIVVVECVVAYLIAPSADMVRAMAGAAMVDAEMNQDALPEVIEEVVETLDEQHEVDLGYFDLTAYQGDANTTLRIEFQLFGIVNESEEDEFLAMVESNQHRLRDQILATMRSVELGDLNDAGLGLIKRRILEKTNKALGQPFLQGVAFSQFSFIEQ